MLIPFYVALAIAILFYVILPVVGAYYVRDQWRRFRDGLLDLSRSPRLRLGEWSTRGASGELEGIFRFHGEIEAIEGEDRMWVRGAGLTAVVDLHEVWYHTLAHEGQGPLDGRYALVERLRWSRVSVVPESTKVFVGGRVRIENGTPVFRDDPRDRLVVVSYQGGEEDLLPRLIAGGRLANEYWTPLSRGSIAFGVASIGILLAFAGSQWLPTVIFLTILVGLSPLLTLLPPGLFFFFLYLRFWRSALDERVIRDLCRLPLRFLPAAERDLGQGAVADAALPEGGVYRVRVGATLPPGAATAIPGGASAPYWTVFTPESSDDPEIARVAVPGDPFRLARESERRALLDTVLSGLFLAACLMVNLVAAFLIWRTV